MNDYETLQYRLALAMIRKDYVTEQAIREALQVIQAERELAPIRASRAAREQQHRGQAA